MKPPKDRSFRCGTEEWSPQVGYFIELHKDRVEPYLEDAERFSSSIRALLKRHLADLGEQGDFYRNDPHYRIPGTPYFHFDVILRDPETSRMRWFYFIVSDEAASFGVLRVVWMDEKT